MSVLAHLGQPIHDLTDGLLHPLTGIDHLLAMVSIGVLAALSTSKRIAWLTPIAFVGGMILGGALGIAGVQIASIDTLVALTVIALGIVLAISSSETPRWLPVIALLFGGVHGVAHGAEAPFAGDPLLYVAGFVAVTAALHAGGTVGGWMIRNAALARVTTGALVSGAGVFFLLTA